MVQRSAATTGGLDGKAHEVLVPPRESQVQAAVPAYAEQLATAGAAPFLRMFGPRVLRNPRFDGSTGKRLSISAVHRALPTIGPSRVVFYGAVEAPTCWLYRAAFSSLHG